jgi:hypothetical protein
MRKRRRQRANLPSSRWELVPESRQRRGAEEAQGAVRVRDDSRGLSIGIADSHLVNAQTQRQRFISPDVDVTWAVPARSCQPL